MQLLPLPAPCRNPKEARSCRPLALRASTVAQQLAVLRTRTATVAVLLVRGHAPLQLRVYMYSKGTCHLPHHRRSAPPLLPGAPRHMRRHRRSAPPLVGGGPCGGPTLRGEPSSLGLLQSSWSRLWAPSLRARARGGTVLARFYQGFTSVARTGSTVLAASLPWSLHGSLPYWLTPCMNP